MKSCNNSLTGLAQRIATQTIWKSPAYGRQRIFRPIRIVASIPKKILIVRQNLLKNFLQCNFTPFMRKIFQIRDHFFPLLFSKDSKNQKSLDIGLWEVGAKRTFKRSEQINKSQLYTRYEQKISNRQPLLSITFLQGFQKSKKFGHWNSGRGNHFW